MGGRGSGGTRAGAGRKSLGGKLLSLHGGQARQPAQAAPIVSNEPLPPVKQPENLPEAYQVLWNELAPHALAARTLTDGTAAAFRDLCEAIILKRMMLAEILADGLTGTKVTLQMDEAGGGVQSVEKKAHTLLSQYRGMMQRVEAGFTRFRLAPMGKEIVVAEKAVDPFEEFG